MADRDRGASSDAEALVSRRIDEHLAVAGALRESRGNRMRTAAEADRSVRSDHARSESQATLHDESQRAGPERLGELPRRLAPLGRHVGGTLWRVEQDRRLKNTSIVITT